MKKLEYRVSFTTPAFLGNAEQQAQWRTPPLKALLRQWWRVAVARSHGFDHRAMRQAEGELFGNAWLTDANGRPAHRKSRVTVRMDPWSFGEMTSKTWPKGMESVTTTVDGKGTVRSDVYLGFGPVLPASKLENRGITIRAAMRPEQSSFLRLALDAPGDLWKPLQLLAWFGALGSRSRNGWGSLAIEAINGTAPVTPIPDVNDNLLKDIGEEWEQCLSGDRDWPHAVGTRDGRPLIWVSELFADWRKAMGCLAHVRVEARRVAKGFTGPDRIGGIHLLGYPAGGKWELPEFRKERPNRSDHEGRLASQLRFKVAATPSGLVGLIFHVPHRFPDVLRGRLNSQQRGWLNQHERTVWRAVHEYLDRSMRVKPLGNAK